MYNSLEVSNDNNRRDSAYWISYYNNFLRRQIGNGLPRLKTVFERFVLDISSDGSSRENPSSKILDHRTYMQLERSIKRKYPNYLTGTCVCNHLNIYPQLPFEPITIYHSYDYNYVHGWQAIYQGLCYREPDGNPYVEFNSPFVKVRGRMKEMILNFPENSQMEFRETVPNNYNVQHVYFRINDNYPFENHTYVPILYRYMIPMFKIENVQSLHFDCILTLQL